MRLVPMNFVARITEIARTSDPDACWDWPGFCYDGYGKVGANLDERGSRVWFAHRAAYTVLIGSVPEELELDHLCRNRRCMNPRHMEPVTPRVNALRSESPIAYHARQTHCTHGHAFTPENTYTFITKYGTTGRACRECARVFRRTHSTRPHGNPTFTAPGRSVTHCRHGHEMVGDNVIIPKDGRRRCRECRRRRTREWMRVNRYELAS